MSSRSKQSNAPKQLSLGAMIAILKVHADADNLFVSMASTAAHLLQEPTCTVMAAKKLGETLAAECEKYRAIKYPNDFS